jgi:hypothetical protein
LAPEPGRFSSQSAQLNDESVRSIDFV